MISEFIVATVVILFGVMIGWIPWQIMFVPMVLLCIFIAIGLVIDGITEIKSKKK